MLMNTLKRSPNWKSPQNQLLDGSHVGTLLFWSQICWRAWSSATLGTWAAWLRWLECSNQSRWVAVDAPACSWSIWIMRHRNGTRPPCCRCSTATPAAAWTRDSPPPSTTCSRRRRLATAQPARKRNSLYRSAKMFVLTFHVFQILWNDL